MADIQNGTITIKGIDELEKKLTKMRTEDPTFEKRLRGAIREILKEARKELSGDAKENLQMQSDPRSAYKAVRSSVYKRLFGGQVNILPSRRAGAMSLYEPPRTLTAGQRGGNRRPRSKRTTDLMSYQGKDRGFILRFLNAGTGDRTINNSTDLAMYLLEEAHVATVGGDAFGDPDCFRMSYATSDENIVEAIRRIKEALGKLK